MSPRPDLLREAKALVSGCDRCGTCLPVCPLFRLQDVERVSARGKNAIARALAEGGLDAGADTRHAVDFCLLCRACTDACPNKVATDEAMIRVRQVLGDAAGGPGLAYTFLGGVLRRRRLVALGAFALATLRRLRLASLIPSFMVPREFPRKAFLAGLRGPAALGGPAPASTLAFGPELRVAYFQGCGMRLLFPDAARSSLQLLNQTAAIAVKDNGCCGLPHLAHGLRDSYLELAKENIALYEDADIVVTDCASCGGSLKHQAGQFAADPEWRERAARFSAKVMDLTEYLVKADYHSPVKRDTTFTFHDPCHLVRGQGIRAQPRQLLAQAGTFVDMAESDTCCGGSGTFHMAHPDAARQLLERKAGNIERASAQVVVTACPGCLIQLTQAADASGGKFQAMHISQVL